MSDQTLENCPICKGQAGKHFGLVGCDESKCNVPQGSFTLEEWQDRTPPPAVTELVDEINMVDVALDCASNGDDLDQMKDDIKSAREELSAVIAKLEGG